MQKRINQNPTISGGIYFVNNTSPIIVGVDWIPLNINFSELVYPNLYFTLENNKLKYLKGKAILNCNIAWSISIKSESSFKVRLINNNNNKVISDINNDTALVTKVIGNKSNQKILLNESFGIEICSEITQEVLISSAFITISE
jgi:hypothetical protein